MGYVGGVAGHKLVALYLRNGAAKVAFLHRSVAYHYHFVHLVGVGFEYYLHRSLAFYVDYLCLVANHRHLDEALSGWQRDGEIAVKVGHGGSLCAWNLDSGAYHRLVVA